MSVSVTDDQIRALRAASVQVGDVATAELCTRALGHDDWSEERGEWRKTPPDPEARAQVVSIIAAAASNVQRC